MGFADASGLMYRPSILAHSLHSTAPCGNVTGPIRVLRCHETTARAARLEQGLLVTLVRLASNAQVFQGYRHGILEDSATPLLMKGWMGFVRGEAW